MGKVLPRYHTPSCPRWTDRMQHGMKMKIAGKLRRGQVQTSLLVSKLAEARPSPRDASLLNYLPHADHMP